MIKSLVCVVAYTILASTGILLSGCGSTSSFNVASMLPKTQQRGTAAMGTLGYRRTEPDSMSKHEFNIGLPNRLTVLTFNMQHRNNPDQLMVVAERLDSDLRETPDFILCQEVLFERSRDPYQENTAALLANDLDCYWKGTKRTTDREGVAIISRYPFEYYAERHLKSQTSRLLAGFRRVSVMGEFNVPDVGMVRVVNVHFTNWGFEKHVRMKQLEETLEWMVERDQENPADVVVFGGDFNAKPGGDELELITEGRFASIFNFRNFNTEQPTRGGNGNFKHRVDYIFVSTPHANVNKANNEQRLWVNGLTSPIHRSRFWPSDHVPVLHEYTVSGRPAIASGSPTRGLTAVAQ